jgi:hypothetical protein
VDTLVRVDTADSGSFVLAVEARRKKDPRKPASWTYYLAYLYAKYQLPPVLVVVCQDRGTAAWAARHLDIGPPQWPSLTVRPLVLGPDNVPVISTPEAAARDIPMTVLSTVLHHNDPEAKAILDTLATVLKDLNKRDAYAADIFVELTAQGLGTGAVAEHWRKLVTMELSFFQSPLAQELRDEGRAEGEAKALLLVLAGRGIDVSDEARERITNCTDHATLSTWLTRSATATSAAEIFEDD